MKERGPGAPLQRAGSACWVERVLLLPMQVVQVHACATTVLAAGKQRWLAAQHGSSSHMALVACQTQPVCLCPALSRQQAQRGHPSTPARSPPRELRRAHRAPLLESCDTVLVTADESVLGTVTSANTNTPAAASHGRTLGSGCERLVWQPQRSRPGAPSLLPLERGTAWRALASA